MKIEASTIPSTEMAHGMFRRNTLERIIHRKTYPSKQTHSPSEHTSFQCFPKNLHTIIPEQRILLRR